MAVIAGRAVISQKLRKAMTIQRELRFGSESTIKIFGLKLLENYSSAWAVENGDDLPSAEISLGGNDAPERMMAS